MVNLICLTVKMGVAETRDDGPGITYGGRVGAMFRRGHHVVRSAVIWQTPGIEPGASYNNVLYCRSKVIKSSRTRVNTGYLKESLKNNTFLNLNCLRNVLQVFISVAGY